MISRLIRKLLLYAILLLAVGLTIPRSRARIIEVVTPTVDRVKLKLVPGRLDAIANQLEARVGRGEGFPAGWEGWLRRDYSGHAEDPWGHIYYLKVDDRGFTVGSAGPDGVEHTKDDITLLRRRRR